MALVAHRNSSLGFGKHLKGFFITLDGIDGAGKSSVLEGLRDWIVQETGRAVTTTRDPGGTTVGAEIRKWMLESDLDIHRRTEAMLFMASRSEMVAQIIQPALDRGEIVISDRYLLSTVVYQSTSSNEAESQATIPTDELWRIGRWSAGNIDPDLTILLDLPAKASMQRLSGGPDRMESRGVQYMERVRQSFLREAPHAGGQVAILDASQSPEDVLKAAIEAYRSQFV